MVERATDIGQNMSPFQGGIIGGRSLLAGAACSAATAGGNRTGVGLR
ncbi:Hypothetical protein GbCGDNIH9_8704 [Granulibacter bethesdensis]|uniref:Uncharacterized protein n=1 Tax=Granulibacter bethesdensis TaxID=364410 RepID=A0AAC9P9L0_9PROT|nr:Hypothetical protein GbCGDNIH9_8704 [Granulibacter bethesdensis]APH63286.1 Hypothetical protein GbCGDNIH8_8704 [Granulibacter bethesdensis]